MSTEIIKQPDYDVNLQYVLEQFKNSENMVGIMKAFNAEMNSVEDALFEIRNEFYLSTAVGDQLDVIGEIFNERRRGRGDDDYRNAIAFVGASRFSGTPEDILLQLREYYGATSTEFRRAPEAGQIASYLLVTDAAITTAQLENISPAGVLAMQGKYLTLGDGSPLTFADGTGIIVTFTIYAVDTFVFGDGGAFTFIDGSEFGLLT
jgi:hypothetical protein